VQKEGTVVITNSPRNENVSVRIEASGLYHDGSPKSVWSNVVELGYGNNTFVKVDGAWHKGTKTFVKVDGTWRDNQGNVKTKINGIWR